MFKSKELSTFEELAEVVKTVTAERRGRVFAKPYAYDAKPDAKDAIYAEAAREGIQRHKAARDAINASWGNVPPVDTGEPVYMGGEKAEGK